MSSIEPNDYGGGVDASKKVGGELVIASCDGAELLELAEEVLDEVSFFVEDLVVRPLLRSARDRWNDRGLAGGQQRLDDAGVGVEGLVGQQGGGFQVRDEGVGALQIVGLAWRQQEPERVAERVDQGVDLGAQSAPAASDRFVVLGLFLRAPALC